MEIVSLLMYSTLLQFIYLLFHMQGTVVHGIDFRSDAHYRYFALEPYFRNAFSLPLRCGDFEIYNFFLSCILHTA